MFVINKTSPNFWCKSPSFIYHEGTNEKGVLMIILLKGKSIYKKKAKTTIICLRSKRLELFYISTFFFNPAFFLLLLVFILYYFSLREIRKMEAQKPSEIGKDLSSGHFHTPFFSLLLTFGDGLMVMSA